MNKFIAIIVILQIFMLPIYGANPPIDKIQIVLSGRDTNTNAEGIRSSDKHLIMVSDPFLRKAKIFINSAKSKGLDNLKPGYPIWSGSGVTGAAGSLEATWEGYIPGTTVKCEYDPGKFAIFPISVVPNSAVNIKIDSEIFKKYIDAANKLINAISEVEDPFKVGGSISGGLAACDMYNDGENLGDILKLGGNINLVAGLPELKKVIPTTIPGVSIRVGAKYDALKITIGGNFIFDEGKQNPWIASEGSISGGATLEITGEGILGIATDKGDAGVITSLVGSTSIKATGVIIGEGRTIYAQGKGEAGKLKVTGSLEARFGPLGHWQIGSVDVTIFQGDEGKSEKISIYTF